MTRLQDALQRMAEAERMAAQAAAVRAAAFADLIAASAEPAPVKGAPDLITMREACQISRLSRQTVNARTVGVTWRFEHPGRTMFERAPFLRWLDQHRAGK